MKACVTTRRIFFPILLALVERATAVSLRRGGATPEQVVRGFEVPPASPQFITFDEEAAVDPGVGNIFNTHQHRQKVMAQVARRLVKYRSWNGADAERELVTADDAHKSDEVEARPVVTTALRTTEPGYDTTEALKAAGIIKDESDDSMCDNDTVERVPDDAQEHDVGRPDRTTSDDPIIRRNAYANAHPLLASAAVRAPQVHVHPFRPLVTSEPVRIPTPTHLRQRNTY